VTVEQVFAYQLATRETYQEGHRYVCPLGVDRAVMGLTKEQCVRSAVVEITGKPWNG